MLSESQLEKLKAQVESSLEVVQRRIRARGGDLTLVDIDRQGVVFIHLASRCRTCAASTGGLTMVRAGLEITLRERFPQISAVKEV